MNDDNALELWCAAIFTSATAALWLGLHALPQMLVIFGGAR